jgi:hypothetical protein
MLLGDALLDARSRLESALNERCFPEYPIEIQREIRELIAKMQTLFTTCRSNDLDRKAEAQYWEKLNRK